MGIGYSAKTSCRTEIGQRIVSGSYSADGRTVELETFACTLDWFGNTFETQIVASDGEYALLGTSLLNGWHLDIDYKSKTVELK